MFIHLLHFIRFYPKCQVLFHFSLVCCMNDWSLNIFGCPGVRTRLTWAQDAALAAADAVLYWCQLSYP